MKHLPPDAIERIWCDERVRALSQGIGREEFDLILREVLAELPAVFDIFVMRFSSARDGRGQTFTDIGLSIDLSSARVAQIESRAICLLIAKIRAVQSLRSVRDRGLSDDLTIECLVLSTRPFNALRAEELYKIHDLVSVKVDRLRKIPNLGRGGIEEIGRALESLGLSFEIGPDLADAILCGRSVSVLADEADEQIVEVADMEPVRQICG